MSVERKRPPRLVERWEAIESGPQAAILFPVFTVLLFLANWGPMNQPAGRSVPYGLIEAIPITAFIVVATANERRKRLDAGRADREDDGA